MKILIICNAASGLKIFRGMLIQNLISNGHELSAIVPQSDLNVVLQSEKELKMMGCELIRLPMERRGINPLKDFMLFKGYYNILKKRKPDLVITYTIKPNIYGGFACRLERIPYAVNITGLGTAFQKKGVLKTLVIVMYKIAIKNAKVVFFENVGNRDTMIKFKITEENKACVLPGAGVDLERYFYAEYPLDTEVTRFIFIGRLMKEKGIEELFEAMKKLRTEGLSCSLDILGDFEENYTEQLLKYEKEGWLHYHGRQSDVRPFIVDSHCFVLPSWHEGMANTNLECAAMGRPIITSNIHGCMEAVIDGKSGILCDIKNVNSLYKAMKEFIQLSYIEKKNMGIIGRQYMESIFDKRKVVEETIERLKGTK